MLINLLQGDCYCVLFIIEITLQMAHNSTHRTLQLTAKDFEEVSPLQKQYLQ